MEQGLFIAIIIVAVVGVVFGIWGSILQLSVFFRYQANNRREVPGGKTAKEIAEEMLAKLGYTDISVRKTSWLWLLFFYKWGNRYSPRRKAIFLYKNILNKKTVTAVAIATQKVGLVIQHKEGDKKMNFRAKWEVWTRLAPNMFLPIIAIGAIIDILVNRNNPTAFGYITLGFVIIAVVYTLVAFAALYLVIPTERRAGQLAMKTIKEHNLVPAEFIENVEKLYKTQVQVYIADFVLAVVALLIDLLYIVAKFNVKR